MFGVDCAKDVSEKLIKSESESVNAFNANHFIELYIK